MLEEHEKCRVKWKFQGLKIKEVLFPFSNITLNVNDT